MWIETFGKAMASPIVAGAIGSVLLAISRRGPWPKAIAAISSIRAIAIRISGTSNIRPSVSANAEPNTK